MRFRSIARSILDRSLIQDICISAISFTFSSTLLAQKPNGVKQVREIGQEYRDCYQQKYEHFLGPVVVSRSLGATVFCL